MNSSLSPGTARRHLTAADLQSVQEPSETESAPSSLVVAPSQKLPDRVLPGAAPSGPVIPPAATDSRRSRDTRKPGLMTGGARDTSGDQVKRDPETSDRRRSRLIDSYLENYVQDTPHAFRFRAVTSVEAYDAAIRDIFDERESMLATRGMRPPSRTFVS